ncbi:MAG: accessory gene regulator B family protein [Alistipes sp.]|nr:accessory gene regulator B family protein [Alistipes sp.]
MIYRLSEKIALYFVKEGIIEKAEKDIYRFGIETILSEFFDMGIVLLTGMLFRRVFGSIWYYIVFCILRHLAEGYHAKTFAMCKMMMFGMMCLVLGLSRMDFDINGIPIMISTVFLIGMIWKIPTRCKKRNIIYAYFLLEVCFMLYERQLAILTMTAFFIVMIASNIQYIKGVLDEKRTEKKTS